MCILSEHNQQRRVHHICYEVEDIIAARDQLKATGARVLGDGNPVLFLHPKDFSGTSVELEQASKAA
jgi:methylmalonyl-CoA/ethylmalonyl-CoA epimerase